MAVYGYHFLSKLSPDPYQSAWEALQGINIGPKGSEMSPALFLNPDGNTIFWNRVMPTDFEQAPYRLEDVVDEMRRRYEPLMCFGIITQDILAHPSWHLMMEFMYSFTGHTDKTLCLLSHGTETFWRQFTDPRFWDGPDRSRKNILWARNARHGASDKQMIQTMYKKRKILAQRSGDLSAEYSLQKVSNRNGTMRITAVRALGTLW